MALSGSQSVAVTSYDTLKFEWSATQSITNNTSTVTWYLKLISSSSGAINSSVSKSYTVIVNGTKYSGTNSVDIGNNATKTLASGTTTITHNTNGTKTFSYSFSQQFNITFSGSTIGTINGSGSGTLNTIPRASSLTVSGGTLGTELSLTINRASSNFTHTITYKCGTATGTVGTGLGTSAKWNTSNGNTKALSSQNKTGTTVSVTFTLTTYSGSTAIGTSTKTVTMNIPSDVVPSISAITLSEASSTVPSGYGYVKDHSKLKIVTTAAGVYSSTIKSIAVVFDSVTYSGSNVTTNVLRYAGTRTVSVTVTDSRGRKATKTSSVTVQAYSEPVINSFTVVRCNADGSLSEQGEYMLITYNASITALGNKNTKNFIVSYKKNSETSYTQKAISSTAYSISGSLAPIPADSGSSYNVRFDVSDTFATVTKNLILSTAFTILNFKADGTGIGVGKVSEESDLFDVDYKVRFNNGVVQPILESGTNFNDLVIPNTYTLKNAASSNYANCPFSNGTGTLQVETCGDEGQLHQIVTVASKTNPLVYERFYYQGAWGAWIENQYDSGWQNCTLQSGFERYATTQSPLQVRRIGKVVHLRGAVKPTTAVTPSNDASTLIAVLDSNFRPTYSECVIGQGSGAYRFLLSINQDGNIYVSRYTNDTTTNKEIAAGAWLNCYATWFIG